MARIERAGPGVVLVCSDGLWNYRPEPTDLAAIALLFPAAQADPLAAAVALVKFAVDAGGADNITAVLAPFPPVWPESLSRDGDAQPAGITADLDRDPYLPVGRRDVSAIVTVTADASGEMPTTGLAPRPAAPAGSAEIIVVDCSGSMDHPKSRIIQARAATVAAWTWSQTDLVAIVAGPAAAWPVYPLKGHHARG